MKEIESCTTKIISILSIKIYLLHCIE